MNKRQSRALRLSNIELLRIAAMLMIVGYHLAYHGIQHGGTSEAYQIYHTGTFINRVAVCLLSPGGEIGVALFFMITGYFRINKKSIVLSRVILECFFYAGLSIVAYVVIKLFLGGFSILKTKDALVWFSKVILTPATGGAWWFVSAYVLMMILSPSLNKVLNDLSRAGFTIVVFLMGGGYGLAYLFNGSYFPLERGIIFYILGAYCRKYTVPVQRNGSRVLYFLAGIVSWTLCAYLCHRVICCDRVENFYYSVIGVKMWSAVMKSAVVSPCTYLCFKLFESFDIGSNTMVNKISSTTFGIYLLHDSFIGRNYIWYDLIKIDTVFYKSDWFPLYAVIFILGVFAVCACIDYLRQRYIEPKVLERWNYILDALKELMSAKADGRV